LLNPGFFCDKFQTMNTTILLFCFLIGFFAGLRSLTPPAVMAWAVHFGWLKPERPFSLIGSMASVVILTVLALAELVADKLPRTPARTAPPGFIARLVTGAFTGACIATSGSVSAIVGAVIGAIGAVAGTFTGYKARTGIVRALGCPDTYIAIAEDLIAIGGSLFVASRF
jgi:uncharacterized membrane protein